MPNAAQIDWRKPNTLLAEEFGLTRERVRQIRIKQRAPAPRIQNVQLKTARRYWMILENKKAIKGRPPAEVSHLLGFDVRESRCVYLFARKSGMVLPRASRKCKHP